MTNADIEDAQHAYLVHAATWHTGQSLAWYAREEELRRVVRDAKKRIEKTFCSTTKMVERERQQHDQFEFSD